MDTVGCNERKLKVLVVDDVSSMRILFRGILREIGVTYVDEATDGVVALQKLKKEDFDLIMADWNMPHMTGIELLKKIKEDASTRKIPVLMVTAEAKAENIVEAAKAGASGYIVKPFSAQTLHEKMSRIFDRAMRH